MQHRWPALALVILLGSVAGGPPSLAAPVETEPVTFNGNIAPLLKANCSPCHFKGGKVFDHLPFDQYATVRKLGERLNTRLKGKDADLVSRWIKGGSPEK